MLNGNHSLGQFLQKSKKIVLGMSLATTMGIALPSVSNAQATTASATTMTPTAATAAPTTADTSTAATSTTASAGDDIQKFVAADFAGRQAMLNNWTGNSQSYDKLVELINKDELYRDDAGNVYTLENTDQLYRYPAHTLVSNWPSDLNQVTLNNALRSALTLGQTKAKLKSDDASERLKAVDILADNIATLDKKTVADIYANEKDSTVKAALAQLQARMDLQSSDEMTQIAALKTLASSNSPDVLADIDALPMAECPQETHRPTREGFASVNPGMMHACGHDGHAAIGLGVAHILAAHRDALHGTVKLIFQPAEEGVRGAYAIVENGWLDDVDVLLASHIAPTGQADDGDVTVGTWGSLATTKYDAVFTGRAAHAGGFPEQGKNALLAAASAALALHAIPRHSGGQSFVNVGTLRAGSGRNVVPDHALMQVEVRGETTEINRFMMARTEEICRGAAAMQGCACSLTVMGTAEGQHSDLALIERIGAVIRRDLPGLTLSAEQNAKNWGSDDVSVMMNRVQAHGGQAAYMRAMADMAGAQHTVTFDFDEAVLGKSVAVFCAAAMALMGEEA